jgi:tRNA pseudouridine38-40 synthase
MRQNYRLTLSYEGTRYHGWERKKNLDTIQGKVEDVLARLCGEEVKVDGAGRTDAGVHARAMTASTRLDTDLSPVEIRDYLNRYLPEDICVSEVKLAAPRFHARLNAVGKTYCYTCWTGPGKPVFDRKCVTVLDQVPELEPMGAAAALLTGEHDFRSFCGNPRMKKSTVRRIDSIDIRQRGSYLTFTVSGSGFLMHMVRILVGTLLEVGCGSMAPEAMTEILAARQRSAAGPTAPAKGLCLMEVRY